jgi:hypothetical protein
MIKAMRSGGCLTVELEATGAELARLKRQLKHCVDRFPELADE